MRRFSQFVVLAAALFIINSTAKAQVPVTGGDGTTTSAAQQEEKEDFIRFAPKARLLIHAGLDVAPAWT